MNEQTPVSAVMNEQTPVSAVKKTNYAFWVGFFGVIIFLFLIVVIAEFKGNKQMSDAAVKQQQTSVLSTKKSPPMQIVKLLIGDKSINILENEFASFSGNLTEKIKNLRDESIIKIEQQIDNEVDKLFSYPINEIPKFMDWYYSLSGEYGRVLNAVSGDMAEYMISKMKENIFHPVGFEYRLDNLIENLDNKAFNEFKSLQMSIAQEIENVLNDKIISTENKDVEVKASVKLGEVFSKTFNVTKKDVAILSASALTASGIMIGGKVLLSSIVMKSLFSKLAGKKVVQMAVALLAKLAIKAGAKGGGALAAGGVGTITCAPLGPFAVGCGAIAGIMVWFAVDEAFIKIDEVINRQEFEIEIKQALIEQRDEIKTQLKNGYKDLMSQKYAEIESQFNESIKIPTQGFIPVDSIKKE